MSRSWVRRGASVLVGAALLGGSVAFGGGTALAQGPDPIVVPLSGWGGSVANLGAGSVVGAGVAGGSVDPSDISPYSFVCHLDCSGTHAANGVEILLNLLQGTDPDRAGELTNDTPDEFPIPMCVIAQGSSCMRGPNT